jgi:hypothetical protein
VTSRDKSRFYKVTAFGADEMLVDLVCPSSGPGCPWTLHERCDQRRESTRFEIVVVVDREDHFAARGMKGLVARDRRTAL